jgi:phosphate transport system permease protein
MEAGQTLATKLGSSETNNAYGDPLHWAAMMALGLVLLALTGALTLTGFFLHSRTRSHVA